MERKNIVKISNFNIDILFELISRVTEIDVRRLGRHLMRQVDYRLFDFELNTDDEKEEPVKYFMCPDKEVLVLKTKQWVGTLYRETGTLTMLKNENETKINEVYYYIKLFFLLNVFLNKNAGFFKRKVIKGNVVYSFVEPKKKKGSKQNESER